MGSQAKTALTLHQKRAAAGRKGGLSRSRAKVKAARWNGSRSGFWRRFTWPLERYTGSLEPWTAWSVAAPKRGKPFEPVAGNLEGGRPVGE
jgi:hypothetical protein